MSAYRDRREKLRRTDARHVAHMDFLAKELRVYRGTLSTALEYTAKETLDKLNAQFDAQYMEDDNGHD